jgi:hypothetical protein
VLLKQFNCSLISETSIECHKNFISNSYVFWVNTTGFLKVEDEILWNNSHFFLVEEKDTEAIVSFLFHSMYMQGQQWSLGERTLTLMYSQSKYFGRYLVTSKTRWIFWLNSVTCFLWSSDTCLRLKSSICSSAFRLRRSTWVSYCSQQFFGYMNHIHLKIHPYINFRNHDDYWHNR